MRVWSSGNWIGGGMYVSCKVVIGFDFIGYNEE